MFCYPKQKTAREWTSGGESDPEPGNTRGDVKANDMPSTQSHLGLLSRIIIHKKTKWKFRLGYKMEMLIFPSCPSVDSPKRQIMVPLLFSSSLCLFLYFISFSVKPLVHPRTISTVRPDNPKHRHQQHDPFHLHFHESGWKHGDTKTPESPMFPSVARCPSAFDCKKEKREKKQKKGKK